MQRPNHATATMRSRRPRRGPTRPLLTPTERKTPNAVPQEPACHVARAKFVATWSSRAPAGTADGTMSSALFRRVVEGKSTSWPPILVLSRMASSNTRMRLSSNSFRITTTTTRRHNSNLSPSLRSNSSREQALSRRNCSDPRHRSIAIMCPLVPYPSAALLT